METKSTSLASHKALTSQGLLPVLLLIIPCLRIREWITSMLYTRPSTISMRIRLTKDGKGKDNKRKSSDILTKDGPISKEDAGLRPVH